MKTLTIQNSVGKWVTVLGCGGRGYCNYVSVCLNLHPLKAAADKRGLGLQIVHGDALGADKLIHRLCMTREIPVASVPADWEALGKAAGPIRNKKMLDNYHVDLCVAFAGGRGTENMIQQAKGRGVPVFKVSDGSAHLNQLTTSDSLPDLFEMILANRTQDLKERS